MSKEIIKRDVGQESFDCIIDVEYVPFPLEEKRREAYYTHAKLFLKAKERQLGHEIQREGLVTKGYERQVNAGG